MNGEGTELKEEGDASRAEGGRRGESGVGRLGVVEVGGWVSLAGFASASGWPRPRRRGGPVHNPIAPTLATRQHRTASQTPIPHSSIDWRTTKVDGYCCYNMIAIAPSCGWYLDRHTTILRPAPPFSAASAPPRSRSRSHPPRE